MAKKSKKKKVLGVEICIPAKAEVFENGDFYKKTYLVPSIRVLIGIGKDHVAELVMDSESWAALNKIKKVDITTL